MLGSLKRWVASIEAEEIALAAVCLLLIPAFGWLDAEAALARVPRGFVVLGIALFVVLPFLLASATRGEAEDSPKERALTVLGLACLGLAIPALGGALGDDTGGFFILALLILGPWVPCVLLSFTRFAPRRSTRVRRALLFPITILNAWLGTELLVDRYVYDESALRSAAVGLDAGDLGLSWLLSVLSAALTASIILAVPYALTVIGPRFAAGERARPATWALRYASFILAIGLGFAAQTFGVLGRARFDVRHRFASIAEAVNAPEDVVVLEVEPEALDRLGIELARFPNLRELILPPGTDHPLEGLDAAARLETLVLSPALYTRIPRSACRIPSLERIEAPENRIETLPDCLAELPALHTLRLAKNRIERLPPVLARIPKLATLELHGNRALDPSTLGELERFPALERVTLPFFLGLERDALAARLAERGVQIDFDPRE